jgi:hypothetical protein
MYVEKKKILKLSGNLVHPEKLCLHPSRNQGLLSNVKKRKIYKDPKI